MILRDNTNTERSLFHVVGKCADFQQEVKSILQEEIESANTELNHQCDFLPKFHCELNPIERGLVRPFTYVLF